MPIGRIPHGRGGEPRNGSKRNRPGGKKSGATERPRPATPTTPPPWGGSRKGAGRPKVHKEEIPARTLWLRATDDEWAAFLAGVTGDAREKFLFLRDLANAQ